jgi:hypothetical protein
MVSRLVAVLALELFKSHPPEPEPVPWLATPEDLAPFSTDGGVAEEALSPSSYSRGSAGRRVPTVRRQPAERVGSAREP